MAISLGTTVMNFAVSENDGLNSKNSIGKWGFITNQGASG